MKINKILQIVWLATGIMAIFIAIYNYMRFGEIVNKVYMPLIISVFCFVLFFNLYRKRNK
ncbi:MAG: hypothetical protein R2836_06650 [Chitinophagales bacterium]|nr:hypothetical protein [Bacteroidota bacterium]MCB9225705.1 hypothetical protein [Chitinophagales bacterium]